MILLVLATPSGGALSQHLRLGAEAGLSFIDMPGFYTQDVSSGGLGFNIELHAGAVGKLELRDSPVTLTGRVQYTWMTGSGTVVSGQVNASAGDYTTFADILIMGAGAEWVVSPGALSPHISTEILLTEAGQVSFAGTSSGSSNPFLRNASTRVGFAVGAGLEHSFSSSFSADLHVRYNWNTLFGRTGDEGNLNTLDVSLAFYAVVF
jgi:opacity protein-like surface antigen